jgi:hypothetical protein
MAVSADALWQPDYDARGDVLYASIGDPQPALSYEIETDILLNYVPPNPRVGGIAVLNFLKHFPRRESTPVQSHAAARVDELFSKYPLVPLL